MWCICMVNVGKYTSPMDPMGLLLDDDSTPFSADASVFGLLNDLFHADYA